MSYSLGDILTKLRVQLSPAWRLTAMESSPDTMRMKLGDHLEVSTRRLFDDDVMSLTTFGRMARR